MGLVNFKKGSDPCPLCGNDYCAKLPDPDGGEYGVLEKRNLPPSDAEPYKYIVSGLNGREYVFVGFSKENFAKFRDKEAVDRAKDAWMREKGYGPYNEKKMKYSKPESQKSGVTVVRAQAKSMTSKAAPAEHNYEPLPPERLHSIYTFIMSQLSLDDWHRKKYEKDGWSANLLLSVRSAPAGDLPWKNGKPEGTKNPTCRELAKRVTDRYGRDILKGVPGAYVGRDGEWTFYCPSGVLFPMYDKDGYLYRLRVRMDYMDVVPNKELSWYGSYGEFVKDGERYSVSMKGFKDSCGENVDGNRFGAAYAGKYRTFQSGNMKEGTPSGNEYSLYTRPGDDMFLCYIVEGEPKSMFSNYRLKSPVVSISGVNSWNCLFRETEGESFVTRMRKEGVEEFVVAYDADAAVNEMVQREKGKLIEELMKQGLSAAEADWSRDYAADPSLKGLDDLLAAGKKVRLKFIKRRKEE